MEGASRWRSDRLDATAGERFGGEAAAIHPEPTVQDGHALVAQRRDGGREARDSIT